MRIKYPRESWADKRIKIESSPISGLGIYATKPIKKGELLLIWGGYLINQSQITNKDINETVVPVEERNKNELIYLKASDEEENNPDPANFINHSCDPNAWLSDAITWIARRDIRKGEEITGDYATFTIDKWGINCRCGENICRKIVTGGDWKLPELQKRYKRHFTPVIEMKVKNTGS